MGVLNSCPQEFNLVEAEEVDIMCSLYFTNV